MKRLALAGVFALLSACASPPPPVKPETVVTLQGDAVVFDGTLRPDSLARIQAAVGQARVSRLIIRSGGGEVTGAIKVARWVYDNGLDVEVDEECFSSCANYIFPAGRNKYITGRGIVAWHGTVEHQLYKHEQGVSVSDAASLRSMRKVVDAERAFYAHAGVNGFAGWFGKVAPYNVYNMYFMSAEDMAYFGMRKLHVRANYLQSDLRKYLKYDARTIRLLAVDRAITNAADARWPSALGAAAAP